MLALPLVIVLILAAAFAGVADTPAAHGALRGMGAVAAGLIAATGIKLIATLRRNPMGMAACWAFAIASFVIIALLRWPLVWVLMGLGALACAWAYRQLGRMESPESAEP
jgi:chromate transporter